MQKLAIRYSTPRLPFIVINFPGAGVVSWSDGMRRRSERSLEHCSPDISAYGVNRHGARIEYQSDTPPRHQPELLELLLMEAAHLLASRIR